MKGGARTRSGVAPDPQALRRDNTGEWLTLPAEGRTGRTPAFPLPDPDARERDLWRTMWRKPQAVEWERLGQHLEVAMYVRRLVEAEERGAPTALGTLVRQMADSLGLTTPGMRANRWQIAPVESVEVRKTARSSRERFTVIGGA